MMMIIPFTRHVIWMIMVAVVVVMVVVASAFFHTHTTYRCQYCYQGETATTLVATAKILFRNEHKLPLSTLLLLSLHHPQQSQQQHLPRQHQSPTQNDDCSSNQRCTSDPTTSPYCLESILRRNQNYQFTQRLITIPTHPSNRTMILAEVYISKEVVLAQILSVIQSPVVLVPSEQQQQQQSPLVLPKFQIRILSSFTSLQSEDINTTAATSMVVDIGQITTIWDTTMNYNDLTRLFESHKKWCDSTTNNIVQEYVHSNMDHIENVLDRLHYSHRSKPNQSGNTKIAIQELMNEVTKFCTEQQEQEYAAMIFRKIFKTGIKFHRIIDSSILLQYLKFPTTLKNYIPTTTTTEYQYLKRLIAAYILANDAKFGGRLKRWPCLYVASTPSGIIRNNDEGTTIDDNSDCTISVINGGWFITDITVRTGTEARKFVERTVGAGSAVNDDAIRDQANHSIGYVGRPESTTSTLADERIFRRLECLAMGELMNTINVASYNDLELDVREVLQRMKLPINPDGAKQALVQTGYWSNDITKQVNLAKMIQPWSKSILDAAKCYAKSYGPDGIHDVDATARIDLTDLPCVCVDAIKTTFRDDAIGVRLRSSTGRAVLQEVSKWEILIHITDVSDIYSIFPNKNIDKNFHVLRDAAARRGSSRYDLPFGPLHLLPPIVLEALSFPTTTGDTSNVKRCRCVTIWAYIDERNGRLVDYGIERTVISAPITLTFGEATNLLNREDSTVSSNKLLSSRHIQAAQAILMVTDRNLKLWDDYERQHNLVAQKREVRLAARERSPSQTFAKNRPSNHEYENFGQRDDGVDGFRRTRGHRLVDSALNLYSNVAAQLVQKIRAPIPRALGADYSTRGGRGGTAPLRRFVDGQIQRQLLALLCHYGKPMTMDECKQVSIVANQATNSINNIRSVRKSMIK